MKRMVLLLALVALLAACSGGQQEETARDLSLVATDIAFDNGRLEVSVNQPVRLTLENAGALEHDFSVREIAVRDMHAEESEADDHAMTEDVHELDLHVAAEPGGGRTVLEFTPTEPGEYEFFCTVAGHKEAGMVGTLVVGP